MITHSTSLRVQYCDTDQMGFVHHSNYIKYYELARMELLRSICIPYKDIEDAGFIMPVIDIKIHYFKPAHFDDELIIKTQLPELKGPKVLFLYHVFNQEGELISEGETTLAFASGESKKACHPPAFFMDAMSMAGTH